MAAKGREKAQKKENKSLSRPVAAFRVKIIKIFINADLG
jgi:hypothetical protein